MSKKYPMKCGETIHFAVSSLRRRADTIKDERLRREMRLYARALEWTLGTNDEVINGAIVWNERRLREVQ